MSTSKDPIYILYRGEPISETIAKSGIFGSVPNFLPPHLNLPNGAVKLQAAAQLSTHQHL